jgi:hypothetical protein
MQNQNYRKTLQYRITSKIYIQWAIILQNPRDLSYVSGNLLKENTPIAGNPRPM